MTNEHLFSAHSNAKLTFMVGIMIGISIMTVGGLAFFTYVLSGGELGTYSIEPLAPTQSILEEPVGEIELSAAFEITEPDATHVFGATENYTVTLVQYQDYECRFCKKFYPEVRQLVADNADSVRLVVKQFPLTRIHPQAKAGAVAAECAADQGKLFEYSARLYDRLDALAVGETGYVAIAEELELQVEQFTACVESEQTVARVEADVVEARSLGIQSQPNLVIWRNDDSLELIDGYVNRAYLESILADELNEL